MGSALGLIWDSDLNPRGWMEKVSKGIYLWLHPELQSGHDMCSEC